MTAETGRFGEPTMTTIMFDIAARLDVKTDDVRLLRLTNNAVFALPSAGLVVRITRSHGLTDRVHKVVGLAGHFAATDAPAIRLAPGIDQPVHAGGLLATVWQWVPPTPPPPPSVTDLGHVLRSFHALPTPPFLLPVWDPVGDARTRIGDAEALRDADRDFLLHWCDALAPRIAALNTDVEQRLVHGDAHVGNLLRRPDSQIVLCDFDATCFGPWQVDLAAVAVGEARFGRAGAHQALTQAYGYDVTTDPAWPLLREARELKMVAAAAPLLASTPGVAHEFTTRLTSIQRGDLITRWTPFADLHR